MEMLRTFWGDKHEFSFAVINFKHVPSCQSFDVTSSQVKYPYFHLYITEYREVAQIFYLGEQTSVIVGHQQMNGVC